MANWASQVKSRVISRPMLGQVARERKQVRSQIDIIVQFVELLINVASDVQNFHKQFLNLTQIHVAMTQVTIYAFFFLLL